MTSKMRMASSLFQWVLLVALCSFPHDDHYFSMAFSTSSTLPLTIRQGEMSTHSSWTTRSLQKRRRRRPLFYIDPDVSSETAVSTSTTASSQTSSVPTAVTWMQSTSICYSDDYQEALQQVLQEWQHPLPQQQSAMAFLFLSPAWAEDLEQISERAQDMLGDQTQLVTVVGGGVIGGGQEVEDSTVRGMSFFGGALPPNSSVAIESFVNDAVEDQDSSTPSPSWSSEDSISNHDVNSYLIFADPYSTKVESVLEECSKSAEMSPPSSTSSNIVAGAVTVAAHKQQSTLAVGNQILPPGSLIRVSFSGNLGVQVVVSQGCRPVGPTYRVTRVNGPSILELDSTRAIDQLQMTIDQDCSSQDKEYIQTKGMTRGVLGGFYKQRDNIDTENNNPIIPDASPEDFIIRQMTGFQPKSGGILLCGRPSVERGDFFRFHVRSPSSALEDWRKILERAKTERLFLGSQAGLPIGAMQFSCAARGEALFEKPNVDLHHVQELLRTSVDGGARPENNDDDQTEDCHPPPVAGFFANAEISSLGNSIRMGASPDSISMQQKSFMHGYATVVAMVCDYSKINSSTHSQSEDLRSSKEPTQIEALGIMDLHSTDVWA